MKKSFLYFVSLLIVNTYIHESYAGRIISEDVQDLGNNKFTTRLIHDPQMVESFSRKYDIPPVKNQLQVEANPYLKSGYEILGMGEHRIIKNESKILYTHKLVDCIGISIWDPTHKIAVLYHASKMELGKQNWMFKDYFLTPLLKEITDPSKTTVNLVSSYWTLDALEVIDLLKNNGFPISGISIPAAVLEHKGELVLNKYIKEDLVPKKYLGEGVPYTTLSMDTQTGQVGFSHN